MSPLTTAFVSPAWPAGSVPNGIVTYTAAITRALRHLGARPLVITLSDRSAGADPFLRTVPPLGVATSFPQRVFQKLLQPIAVNYARDRIFVAGLLSEIRRLRHQEDLRLVEMEESFGWAGLLARKSPVPVVVRLHGPWFINGPAVGAKPDQAFHRRDRLEGMAIAQAAGVSAGCRSVLERTRQHFGLPLSNASAIPYPVDPIPPAGRWTLAGCEPGRVLFVGRFDRHKGGDILLRAFSHVLRQMPSARLDLVGPDVGVEESGRRVHFQEFLTALFDASAAGAAIKLHGFRPLDQLPPFRRRAQITVVCSRDEVFPLTALDALALGCPLVVSSAGGLVEMVQDRRNGLVFKNEDPHDLAEKMLLLLRDPDLCARLGRQAAEDTASLYHPEIAAKKTLDFYEQVLSRWTQSNSSVPSCVQG
jgi:glycosyltransferase involved in cell wall biosynthesis